MIERLVSLLLTSKHIDVSDMPANYHVKKSRMFPNKKLLRMMDSNRQYRQSMRHNSISVQEIHSPELSYDSSKVGKVQQERREAELILVGV
jgi:hypothetical protein